MRIVAELQSLSYSMTTATIEKPFTVSVSDADLDQLRQRLALTRFPDEVDEVGWEYGAPLTDVRRLAAYWKDGFDWRKAEAGINALPQFTRDLEVEGFGTLNVHYVHKKSEVTENAVPLLFIHGCRYRAGHREFGEY